jgi:hypothetical protein
MLRKFLVAGALVAVLDISFADTYWVVFRGATTLQRIFQSIAAGVLGKDAFTVGSRAVLLGVVLHCVIAFGWTAVFFALASRWPAFRRVLLGPSGALRVGLPFGMLVWLSMNLVIIPLSHTRPTAIASTWFWVCLVWHAVGVGLPMALIWRAGGASRATVSA